MCFAVSPILEWMCQQRPLSSLTYRKSSCGLASALTAPLSPISPRKQHPICHLSILSFAKAFFISIHFLPLLFLPVVMNADRNASSNQDRSPKPASQVSTLYNAQITDADDDDMDFEPSTTEDSEYFEADDDENPSGVEYDLGEDDGDDVEVSLGFHDAAEEPEGDDDSGPGGAGEIQLNVEHAADGSIHVTQAATEGGPPAPIISRAQILGLLNTTNLRRLLELHGGGGVGLVAAADEEDGDDTGWGRRRRRRNPRGEGVPLPPVPNPEGEKLMGEGVFGRNEDWEDAARTRKKSAARRLMMRELGLDGFATPRENEHVSQVRTEASDIPPFITK